MVTAARIKYLASIQSVISRMAANQFTTRKWSVALGTALIGWAVAKDAQPGHALIAVLPAACFWILDAYYLSQERCFRDIYNRECAIPADPATFSLATAWGARDWLWAFVRPAVWLVHLPVIVAAIAVWSGKWQI